MTNQTQVTELNDTDLDEAVGGSTCYLKYKLGRGFSMTVNSNETSTNTDRPSEEVAF